MAEIIVENQTCPSCGVSVRPQALFCYNCGGAVSEKKSVIENSNGSGAIVPAAQIETLEKPIESVPRIVETKIENQKNGTAFEDKPAAKNAKIHEEAKLKSAAAMRRKAKSVQKQEVEVVWEEPENISGVKLLIAAVLLAVFAIAVVMWALAMK